MGKESNPGRMKNSGFHTRQNRQSAGQIKLATLSLRNEGAGRFSLAKHKYKRPFQQFSGYLAHVWRLLAQLFAHMAGSMAISLRRFFVHTKFLRDYLLIESVTRNDRSRQQYLEQHGRQQNGGNGANHDAKMPLQTRCTCEQCSMLV